MVTSRTAIYGDAEQCPGMTVEINVFPVPDETVVNNIWDNVVR